jgi:Tfp pilus assembly protein PilF
MRAAAAAFAALCALPPLLAAAPARDDYASAAFNAPLGAALRAFYTRDFAAARRGFEAALAVIPDNTLALAFLDATAAQTPGQLDALIAAQEDALARHPHDALAHLRLGFSYLFAAQAGRDRAADAREELEAALQLAPSSAAAHTGLGIMREGERSANRAKNEFLAALALDPNDVLAREYLARIEQNDLRDPRAALTELVDLPNLVPDYADAYFHLASALHALGQDDAAAGYATRGLETDLGHVGESGQHGYTLLARIYLDQRRLGDARRVLRASIAAGADEAYATTLLAKIARGDYGTPAPEPSGSPVPKRPV